MDGLQRYTVSQMRETISYLLPIFDVVRLVDPRDTAVLTLEADGTVSREPYTCFRVWNKDCRCGNCTSIQAALDGCQRTKYEFIQENVFYVVSRPLLLALPEGETPVVMEIVSHVSDQLLLEKEHGKSLAERTRTVPPAKILAETALMPWGSVTAQFWRLAHSSTVNRPPTSVAVVMTATAPQIVEISLARSLAPPRCPDTTGTAKRPHSSTATTAGSRALLFRKGATARTAMPTAPTNTSASKEANASSVHRDREKSSILRVHDASPPSTARSRSARACPLSVKDR